MEGEAPLNRMLTSAVLGWGSRIDQLSRRTMTSPRHRRKQGATLAALFGLFLATGSPLPVVAQAALAAPLVVNPDTGLAISGFDPVAYFTDGKALAGRPALEVTLAGTIWRFQNEGNRAAFLDNPDVYTPRFGGYDPVAIGRGRSVPGHPLFFAVAGERLYLFYSEADRDAFKADPGRVIDIAERRWPEVARTLGR